MEIFSPTWMLSGVKTKSCLELAEKTVNKTVILSPLFESFFRNRLGTICNSTYFNLRLHNGINQ